MGMGGDSQCLLLWHALSRYYSRYYHVQRHPRNVLGFPSVITIQLYTTTNRTTKPYKVFERLEQAFALHHNKQNLTIATMEFMTNELCIVSHRDIRQDTANPIEVKANALVMVRYP